jgi:hypothetical protein
MEDESRPLPPGWVRQFDPTEGHQFFVDTKANPPRSIWTHPYDDEEFLKTLTPDERREHARIKRSVTLEDLAAEDTDDEDHHHAGNKTKSTTHADLPPRPGASTKTDPNAPTGIHKFGRKMKDKLTSSTHEERERQRRQRAEAEQRAYEKHMQARRAMVRAMETGEPQLLGKDAQGRDVYIESPYGPPVPRGAYGYNPYQNGPYANPNVRYVRPQGPYGRPGGFGYGGGYGGFGAPLAAGVLGGALMGGLLF